MTKKTLDPSMTEFEKELQEQAELLKTDVDQGNIGAAMRRIAQLGEVRDQSLYKEVGRLTRSLHEALRNFQITGHNAQQEQALSKMADASDRLDYVVTLTGQSANKTMDLVEESMPATAALKEEAEAIKADWGRLRRREMKPSEFRALYCRIDEFLERVSTETGQVNSNLSEILLAQDFQDLTGQVIQRVTTLVRDVEDNLVNLMVMASDVDRITGTVHEQQKQEKKNDEDRGVGPQIDQSKDDVVSSQDDVDDLLSSLGF